MCSFISKQILIHRYVCCKFTVFHQYVMLYLNVPFPFCWNLSMHFALIAHNVYSVYTRVQLPPPEHIAKSVFASVSHEHVVNDQSRLFTFPLLSNTRSQLTSDYTRIQLKSWSIIRCSEREEKWIWVQKRTQWAISMNLNRCYRVIWTSCLKIWLKILIQSKSSILFLNEQ